MQKQIGEFTVTVRRKAIRHLHLYVFPPDGNVVISVPTGLSDSVIDLFVRTHAGWIRDERKQIAEQPRLTPRQWVSGEAFYYFGRQYVLKVEHGERGNSLVLKGNRAVLTVRKASTATQRGAWVKEWYRARLKEAVEKALPLVEQQTGLRCLSWQIKEMTTLWSSCAVKTGRLLINLELAKKPRECLRYILIHELGHFVSRRHDAAFTAYMDKQMPQWPQVRQLLNAQPLETFDPHTEENAER